METLDKDKTGLVTFDQFVSWWLESHRGPERGDKYQARFKLIRAKLEDNVNRIDISKIQTQQVAKIGSRRFRCASFGSLYANASPHLSLVQGQVLLQAEKQCLAADFSLA